MKPASGCRCGLLEEKEWVPNYIVAMITSLTTMARFFILLAVALLPGAFAAAFENLLQLKPNSAQAGTFYSFWSEGGGSFRCQNGGGGKYSVTWSGKGGFVCGKGYSPGGSRSVISTPSTRADCQNMVDTNLVQGRHIQRHVQPHRPWLPCSLWLDARSPHRVLHRRLSWRPHPRRAVD